MKSSAYMHKFVEQLGDYLETTCFAGNAKMPGTQGIIAALSLKGITAEINGEDLAGPIVRFQWHNWEVRVCEEVHAYNGEIAVYGAGFELPRDRKPRK